MGLVSCNKNNDDPNNENGNEGPSVPIVQGDPEGTVTINLNNGSDGNWYDIGIGHDIHIDNANNFEGADFVCLGELDGLRYVTTIPSEGWSSAVAVVPRQGYVARFNGHYARLYVVDYYVSTQGGIMGATIKYQAPFLVPILEPQNLPYIQSFNYEFGTYTTYNVSGPQTWMIKYQTATMTGLVNPTNYANEDWLISSPVAITDVEDVRLSMSYIGRYFNNINEEITFLASTNYIWGEDPRDASWTKIPATLMEGNNWNDFLTVEVSLNDFIGKTIFFAVKYTSTASKAGTMEIREISIQGH